jgi:pyruvate dehydrogenase E2 component (dihydrolipoamide acetyltransferase)
VAVAITVPRRGWSMEEGKFAGWLKPDGAPVREGDLLFVLESDKAAEEVEAIDAGILRIPPDGPKIGDTVKVGQELAYLMAEGEAAPAERRGFSPGGAAEGSPGRVYEPGDSAETESRLEPRRGGGTPARSSLRRPSGAPDQPRPPLSPGLEDSPGATFRRPSGATGRKPAISPRARRTAAELGVDWSGLPGSGRNGRIRERDVRVAAADRPGGRLILHTPVRRTIAARMVAGVTQAAHVTLTTRADASNLVNLRQQFKATADVVPSYTDLLVKLAAVALRRHPLLQAQWRDDGLFVPDRVDVAVAVDTEAGLLVPVIRAADRLTLRQVAAQSRDLIAQARAGRLTAEQMRDATFTITNLGPLGIDAFTPILHLPQCAVLGVGRIVREPAVVGDCIVPRDAVTLSLTFDHRVVDGAPAARFLGALRGGVEQPAPWLMP